ncbi:MAG TPA: PQQ-dependent sugar dehydrogenase [Kofleriaceae bacterium]|jgi:glucose/arabinose dehydrogenase|nr:PQQ-dependent sugar dehydrogenase [Kofleriaceae bacterium]
MQAGAWVAVAIGVTGACYGQRPSQGGGQITKAEFRDAIRSPANPHDIDVPPGYRVELVAQGLTFPTGVAFGPAGEVYVVESGYSYGERLTTPRIVEVEPRGELRVVLEGPPSKNGAPWNGIAYRDGALFVAHGGAIDGGSIVRYDVAGGTLGAPQVLVEGLPGIGDHHTNGPVISRDGWVYFGQGTVTNSAVVGPDNADFGWLGRHPELHDIPCTDVTLAGLNFTSKNPLTLDEKDEVTTGAYLPFGTPSTPGQVIKGSLPCSGAIMRVRTTGGPVELVAWGFRNPFGLALGPDDTLYVTDNGFDTRGSRPVFGGADMLWRVEPGRWYGWPDFSEGRPLTASWYAESNGAPKGFVLAQHPGQPPEPTIYFPVHSCATGFDFSRDPAFGHVGEGFVALFGDMAPNVGKVLHPVGFAVMKVNPESGELEFFARNHADEPGPGSKRENHGFERPVAARFDPSGKALYVVDFGVMQMSDRGANPIARTGKLWRITKEAPHASR